VQQARGDQMVYAGLGWRAAAVIVDTLLVLFAAAIVLAVLSATGTVDLGLRSATTLNDIVVASRNQPGWFMPAEYGAIFVYFTLFELAGSTPGKRLFRLSVAKDDGTRLSPAAVVVRNFVRIPEMLLWYVPSAISCLASDKDKRLGDFAAHSVVLRRVTAAGGSPAARPATAAPPVPATATPAPDAVADPLPLALDRAVPDLKAAALAVRGAHLNYLRFSEIELAKGEAHAAADEPDYSPEYASAWYTLADAVITMQHARTAAHEAAQREGTTLEAACAGQPDLVYLFGELEPYFTAGSDEQVHEAYIRVARAETAR